MASRRRAVDPCRGLLPSHAWLSFVNAHEIAVVGMACWYPGAPGLLDLWENVLAKRRQFRRILDCRMPLADYHDADRAAPDLTYGLRAAYIDGFEFDWRSERIPHSTAEVTDIVHWLALDVARRAVLDAGLSAGRLPQDSTAVYVGNTLTGEWTRANALRLRWPYVRRSWVTACRARGMAEPDIAALVPVAEAAFKAAFPPASEDTLAGALSNTIAGRICNALDLHGGGYTVDGACASSLLAVQTGANELSRRAVDVAIVGGVDVSLDPFELVGFAKAGALASDDMRVYDSRAAGFFPGEGCGFAVLKRLDDARRDGDYVWARLTGWGVSSDGRGGITAPGREGQALALGRAFAMAGVPDDGLDFVEGHGTGTALGDRTELEAIALALERIGTGRARSCGVTSFKSIVGHTKAAAGIGGFIKATIAVHRRVLPPTAGCDDPHPVFDAAASMLYPLTRGEVRDAGDTLRAGVSAMGFGGINSHVVIESGDAPDSRLRTGLPERALMASAQSAEVVVFSAMSAPALAAEIAAIADEVVHLSSAELADFAADRARHLDHRAPVRAALVARDPEELVRRLAALARLLETPLPERGCLGGRDAGVWVAVRGAPPRIGFLFPGQGAQQPGMARHLVERHDWAARIVADADVIARRAGIDSLSALMFPPLHRAVDATGREDATARLRPTDVAQPALCVAALLWATRLRRLGIEPVAVGGHSLGELCAFRWAGAFDDATLLRLATMRGRAMDDASGHDGAMAALACDADTARALIDGAGGAVVVANINGPRQVVVSGEASAVAAVVADAYRDGIDVRPLAVSGAFHSPLVAAAAATMALVGDLPETLGETSCALFLGADGTRAATGLELAPHFAQQIVAPVDFVSLAGAMREHCDVLVEVGVGRVLTGLVADIFGAYGPRCLPVESRVDEQDDLATLLATLHVLGADIRWSTLCEDRFVRPYVPPSRRRFLVSPCERSAALEGSMPAPLIAPAAVAPARAVVEASPSVQLPPEVASADPATAIEHAIIGQVAASTGFAPASLHAGLRLLDDLNLDSIKASQLASQVAQRFGVQDRIDPTAFAMATVGQLRDALVSVAGAPAKPAATPLPLPMAADVEPEPGWVRSFALACVPEDAATDAPPDAWRSAHVALLADAIDDDLATALAVTIRAAGGSVQCRVFVDAASPDVIEASHVIALLPRDGTDGWTEAAVDRAMRRLEATAAVARSAASAHLAPSVVFVQFGGGDFGAGLGSVGIGTAGARAFAAALHLERHCAVQVIDCDPVASVDALAARLAGVVATTTGPWCIVALDGRLRRLALQARVCGPMLPRSRPLAGGDVVLVTGGGRGITAACALALARQTGVRLALVGSTDPEGDDTGAAASEVRATLRRAHADGIGHRYYCCDVGDAAAVTAMVAAVRRDFGRIDAVVHGAGANHPAPIARSTADDGWREVRPKLIGAMHLADALAAAPPRLFVALTSIIGVTGMEGNAWYGFANEALDLFLGRFHARHPACAVLSIGFGVWANVGMGARLGSARRLAHHGLHAIDPVDGADRFVDLVLGETASREIIVTGRMGGMPTWPVTLAPPRPDFGFLETTHEATAGVAGTFRARLDSLRDPWLTDHVLDGNVLLPAVFGLEAMAQAAVHVLGIAVPDALVIEDIELARPVAIDPVGGTSIEVRVLVAERGDAAEPSRVHATIRTEATGYARDHFAATFVFESPDTVAPVEPFAEQAFDLRPGEDLYGSLLFQGPRFQRIGAVRALAGEGCDVVIGDPLSVVADAPPQRAVGTVLGDPFVRDALLQAAQLTIPGFRCLPGRIGRLAVWRSDRSVVRTRLDGRNADYLTFGVDALDARGRIVEQMRAYRVKILSARDDAPDAAELVAPDERDTTRLQAALDSACVALDAIGPRIAIAHIAGLHALDAEGRHRLETPILQRTAARVRVGTPVEACMPRWLASGVPVVAGIDHDILAASIAHDERVCVCAAGETAQGCDVLVAGVRTDEEWLALLGIRHADALAALVHGGDAANLAGARLWAAQECTRKASQCGMARVEVGGRAGSAVLLRATGASGTVHVVTLPLALTRGPVRVFGFVVQAGAAMEAVPSPRRTDVPRVDGRPGPGFSMRVPLTMRESGGVGRGIYFSTYFTWMGRVRELALQPVVAAIAGPLTTGRWGMVTNDYGLHIHDDASLGDEVLSTVTIPEPPADDASSAELLFTWQRVSAEGDTRPLASGRMRVTWVEILGHGQVRAATLPEALVAFLRGVSGVADGATVASSPDLGRCVARPVGGHRLAERRFDTATEDSNAVGNLYFANYPAWAGRVRDGFFHHLEAAWFRAGTSGELLCLETRMTHLREAMPFDRILVQMSLEALFECGAQLRFDYFRIDDRGRTKLASGQHLAAVGHHEDGRGFVLRPWPAAVLERLLEPGDACGPCASVPADAMASA